MHYRQVFTIKNKYEIRHDNSDVIIPREIEYSYKLMFEERSIMVKAYNLITILAEKIESILPKCLKYAGKGLLRCLYPSKGKIVRYT